MTSLSAVPCVKLAECSGFADVSHAKPSRQSCCASLNSGSVAVYALQGNVAAELVVCHVLLGAAGAAENMLLSESRGRAATPPSGSKVQPVGLACSGHHATSCQSMPL